GQPAVSVMVITQPGANVIDVVDRVRAELPRLGALLPAGVDLRVSGDGANRPVVVGGVRAELPRLGALLPAGVDLRVSVDRTTTIRASVRDVERTLAIAIGLVVLVVFAFLRRGSVTLIPSLAVPLSLLGTFGVMWAFGYSLDNLSLMALTISTGFVVDDAIVVLENVTRRLEKGETRLDAAVEGTREIGFTVLAM